MRKPKGFAFPDAEAAKAAKKQQGERIYGHEANQERARAKARQALERLEMYTDKYPTEQPLEGKGVVLSEQTVATWGDIRVNGEAINLTGTNNAFRVDDQVVIRGGLSADFSLVKAPGQWSLRELHSEFQRSQARRGFTAALGPFLEAYKAAGAHNPELVATLEGLRERNQARSPVSYTPAERLAVRQLLWWAGQRARPSEPMR